jgi:rubredoxin
MTEKFKYYLIDNMMPKKKKKKKKIEFDGSLYWICPHCGAENDSVTVLVRIQGTAKTTASRFVISDKIEVDDYDYEPELEEIGSESQEDYLCPECEKSVTAEDIRRGFHDWLEQLKDAELLSEYFEEE